MFLVLHQVLGLGGSRGGRGAMGSEDNTSSDEQSSILPEASMIGKDKDKETKTK